MLQNHGVCLEAFTVARSSHAVHESVYDAVTLRIGLAIALHIALGLLLACVRCDHIALLLRVRVLALLATSRHRCVVLANGHL